METMSMMKKTCPLYQNKADRGTAIGGIISQYLEKKCELEDHAVHLLFSANRWEAVPKMKEHLLQGTTLIVDRYAFSGVAFTAAKQGFGLDWCRQPDIGLPKPDLVLYLTLTPEEAAKRGGFGGERYENTPFQEKVAKNFEHLKENNWRVIDAGKDMESLHEEIQEITRAVIKDNKDKDIEKLWINHDYPVKKRKSLGEINTNQCMGDQLNVK
ncbi:thymidylate kinase-like [Lingula anatina]|uniref:Thymidylate kinase n=1 Tax=Lingula anatina TaxID=7574 RepID=A0A1S3K4G2_LINAN|nr:thymidylate kinase-like [Lingula anatina]|eukprot:XP_013417412.1 thymidylate kinase-like [Lingula anatina]